MRRAGIMLPWHHIFPGVIEIAVAVEVNPGIEVACAAGRDVEIVAFARHDRRREEDAVFIVAIRVTVVAAGNRARLTVRVGVHACAEPRCSV